MNDLEELYDALSKCSREELTLLTMKLMVNNKIGYQDITTAYTKWLEYLKENVSKDYEHLKSNVITLSVNYLKWLNGKTEWKDSQPQIIEIFGKRVIVVKDKNKSDGRCGNCALFEQCYSGKYTLCETTDGVRNRYFVEVDEDGNEIQRLDNH